MTEKIVQYGSNSELTGIITTPKDSSTKNSNAILLLNAGLIHKVGFNRFNTEFARLMSGSGFSSLRFDLHGIGDSAHHDGKNDYDKQVQIDIHDSVDYLLHTTETTNAILVGLCSGADYAHAAAVRDCRISGAALLDTYAYPTIRFRLNDYAPVLFSISKISRFLNKILYSLTSKKAALKSTKGTKSNNDIYMRTFPLKKTIQPEIQRLINRNVKLLYIYSGGVPTYYNYENQFFDMFKTLDFKNNVTYKYFKYADHIYTLTSYRQLLFNSIANWVKSNFN
jgi:alpha/beta superfamily hydrolase